MRFPILATLVVLPVLAALPSLAHADEKKCEFTAPRALTLDIGTAKAVVFEVNSHNLHVTGAPGAANTLTGRACASHASLLPKLTVTQRHSGDKLVVALESDSKATWFLGNSYAFLDITASVPDGLPVQLKIGSGDAWATGIASASVDVGSGDVDVRKVRGLVTAAVGSGDVTLDDIGSLTVVSIGSGDLEARTVRGAVKIGSIGSGDLKLRTAKGDVSVESVNSGDLDIADVEGSVSIGSVGSGDVTARRVSRNVSVDSIGSGDVNADDVGGDVTVRTVGSGRVDTRGVKGTLRAPSND